MKGKWLWRWQEPRGSDGWLWQSKPPKYTILSDGSRVSPILYDRQTGKYCGWRDERIVLLRKQPSCEAEIGLDKFT